jgi:BASS family bile acid:Na+ symporter
MINQFLREYLGLGTLAIIILALFFPYVATSLHPYALFFLFMQMLANSINIDWSKFRYILKNPSKIIFANIYIFIFTPIIIYLIADFLFDDRQFVYAAVFTALAPCAIVAPYFTRVFKGNVELSYSILISSLVISPIVIPFLLKISVGSLIPINSLILFKDILLIAPLPMLIGFIIWKYFPKLNLSLTKNSPILNFIFLALLQFILFGVSLNKFNFNHLNTILFAKILLITFIQDFGIILIWKLFNIKITNADTQALIISISMQNIAIAAGILLLHAPKVAIYPAIGFIPHAFLFTPFILRKLIHQGCCHSER